MRNGAFVQATHDMSLTCSEQTALSDAGSDVVSAPRLRDRLLPVDSSDLAASDEVVCAPVLPADAFVGAPPAGDDGSVHDWPGWSRTSEFNECCPADILEDLSQAVSHGWVPCEDGRRVHWVQCSNIRIQGTTRCCGGPRRRRSGDPTISRAQFPVAWWQRQSGLRVTSGAVTGGPNDGARSRNGCHPRFAPDPRRFACPLRSTRVPTSHGGSGAKRGMTVGCSRIALSDLAHRSVHFTSPIIPITSTRRSTSGRRHCLWIRRAFGGGYLSIVASQLVDRPAR